MRITSRSAHNVSCTYPTPSNNQLGGSTDVEEIAEIIKKSSFEEKVPGLHIEDMGVFTPTEMEQIFKSYRHHADSLPWIQTNVATLTPDMVQVLDSYEVGVNIVTDGGFEGIDGGLYSEQDTGMSPLDVVLDLHGNISGEVNIILVVHKGHTGTEGVVRLKDWVGSLTKHGISGTVSPVHPVSEKTSEFDLPAPTNDGLLQIYNGLWEVIVEDGVKWSPFLEIESILQGKIQPSDFVNGEAGPFVHTPPVEHTSTKFVKPCKRSGLSDLDYIPENNHNGSEFQHIRQQALKSVSEEHNGCKGCSLFEWCQGGDPVNGVGADWRQHSVFCDLIKSTFENIGSEIDGQVAKGKETVSKGGENA